jgi:hypothetical protein
MIVNLHRFRPSLFWTVAAISFIACMAGCGMSGFTWPRSVSRSQPEASHRHALPQRQVVPVERQTTPRDAADDSDERHPSRWKKKLRVKYVMAQ